eukprot:3722465-Rhodomonas_salina.2
MLLEKSDADPAILAPPDHFRGCPLRSLRMLCPDNLCVSELDALSLHLGNAMSAPTMACQSASRWRR